MFSKLLLRNEGNRGVNTKRKQGEIKAAAGVLAALTVLVAGAGFYLYETNASLMSRKPAAIPQRTIETTIQNEFSPVTDSATLLVSGNASMAVPDSGSVTVADEAIDKSDLEVPVEEAPERIYYEPYDLIGFGRESDYENMEYWERQEFASADRSHILSFLAYVPEYQELCEQYHIRRKPEYIDLIAVGDNLYHTRLTNSGLQSDGTYNYDAIYENITDYLSDIEIKVINQEVVITSDSSKWSGFPVFAAPIECGEAVVKAGFNVITHATNHSWDKGMDVALEDIAFWNSQEGVLLTGMYASQEDRDTIVIGEYNGVKVAFLNYTYNLNGFSLPSDAKYMVNLLDMDLVISDIEKAREQADIVIVFPHWGEEYKTTPNAGQRQMAQQMADAGADLIIGCHPHVVQPLEIITSADGREVPCYYSLGNFVSNMPWADKCVEAMARVRIKKDGDKISIDYCEAIPLVNYYDPEGSHYTVYFADDYTDEIAWTHRNSDVTPRFVENFFYSVMKESKFYVDN